MATTDYHRISRAIDNDANRLFLSIHLPSFMIFRTIWHHIICSALFTIHNYYTSHNTRYMYTAAVGTFNWKSCLKNTITREPCI